MIIFDTNHNKSKCTYKKFRIFFFHSKRESKNITEDSQTHGPTYVCVCMYVCMDACMHASSSEKPLPGSFKHSTNRYTSKHFHLMQYWTSNFLPTYRIRKWAFCFVNWIFLLSKAIYRMVFLKKKKEKKKVNAIRD